MAVTETDICNRALARLGQTQITNISANATVEGYCRGHFAPLRQELLRSHPWNFALRREPLALRVDQPRFGPLYQFELPPGYIHTVDAFTDMEGLCKIDRFFIEEGYFRTNFETANLLYVEDKTDPTTWDAGFANAFSLTLAARLAVQIKNDQSTAQLLLQEVEQLAMPKAMLYNAREDTSNENSPVANFINGADINRAHYAWGMNPPLSCLDFSGTDPTF